MATSSGKSIAIGAVIIGGFALPVVAFALLYKSCLGTTVRGSVTVRGDGPDLRRRLGGCRAEADGRAVVLTGGDGVAVRAAVDPIDGMSLELRLPERPPLALDPKSCPGLTVELRTAGKRDDGSAILDGNFLASCKVADGPMAGATVDVEAWWKSCKLPRE